MSQGKNMQTWIKQYWCTKRSFHQTIRNSNIILNDNKKIPCQHFVKKKQKNVEFPPLDRWKKKTKQNTESMTQFANVRHQPQDGSISSVLSSPVDERSSRLRRPLRRKGSDSGSCLEQTFLFAPLPQSLLPNFFFSLLSKQPTQA